MFKSCLAARRPQWVFDSVNTGVLLPTPEYGVGAKLPVLHEWPDQHAVH